MKGDHRAAVKFSSEWQEHNDETIMAYLETICGKNLGIFYSYLNFFKEWRSKDGKRQKHFSMIKPQTIKN